MNDNQINEKTLTKEIKKSIEDLIVQKKSIEFHKKELSEAIEAVAEKLGVNKSTLTRRLNLIIKEEEKGGEIKNQNTDLDFVEKYFNIE